jgi:hypothetical protein
MCIHTKKKRTHSAVQSPREKAREEIGYKEVKRRPSVLHQASPRGK